MRRQNRKQGAFARFIAEWGLFSLTMALGYLSIIFVWNLVVVDGHSMDPTLADKERLVIVKVTPIDRFDIVVAKETDDDGKEKQIVKRVIGMPGDTIRYENDQLYINGEKTDEPYLTDYMEKFKDDRLQSTYSYNSFFQRLAQNVQAFTVDKEGNPNFTIEVPQGEYLLLGDDRIVSKDSRQVGTFKAEQIQGEAKVRFWPFKRIGTF
ncbi:signal peptidase I [Streptococcus himalayensis]|uniref:Signal peptidase I n=1 Tax=Streptococcus himalayensis TaxID=1888195 RepID=A0A917AAZ7_9STRE|nr:signal peptidase I [Streptococcus himalayensis]GGE36211.1 signal peptidase I [Streptococcus himalayensis]